TKGFGESFGRLCRRRAAKFDARNRRLATSADEIVLKSEHAVARVHQRPHGIVAHGHDVVRYTEATAKMRGDVTQRFPPTEAIRAFQMRGEVAIAESKPRVTADELQRLH